MSEPAWWRIAHAIARDIREGKLGVGDRIMPARDLGPAHGVDANTARVATSYLRDIGVLTTVPGSGTFVAASPPVELPQAHRMSALERRINARIDALERRLDEHERGDHS